jgi:hypothetical protein
MSRFALSDEEAIASGLFQLISNRLEASPWSLAVRQLVVWLAAGSERSLDSGRICRSKTSIKWSLPRISLARFNT